MGMDFLDQSSAMRLSMRRGSDLPKTQFCPTIAYEEVETD